MITERKHLADQLSLVKRAVSTRSTIQILQQVRITCNNGDVTIRATDMEVAASIGVTVLEAPSNFDVIVPFAELEQLVKAMQHDRVWIDETDLPEAYVMLADGTNIDSPTEAWIEQIEKREDFPEFPAFDQSPKQEIVLTTTEFAEAAGVVLASASKDQTRPVLCGVCIDVANDDTSITFASTDSYRLHVSDVQGVSNGERERRVIPARFVRFILDYAKKGKHQVVTIRFGDHHAWATFDGSSTVLTGRIIEGTFPNYNQLIPASMDYLAAFDAEQLLIGLKQVIALREGRNDPAVLHLQDGKWYVSDRAGKGTVHLSKANGGPYPDDRFGIGVNPEFFASAIKAMDDETVIVEILSPLRPVLVSAKSSTRRKALVMPIRLDGTLPPVGGRHSDSAVKVAGVGKVQPEVEPEPSAPVKALRKAVTGKVESGEAEPIVEKRAKDEPANRFLIEANVAMAKHYRATDLKTGPEREEKLLQRTYHNGIVAYYLGKRKTFPSAGELAPGKASVVKARLTRIAGQVGFKVPER